MISYMIGASTASPPNTAVRYMSPVATSAYVWQQTEANIYAYIPHALTLSNLRVTVTVAPGSGANWVFTLMKNGSTTGLTCTIAGTNTSAQDLSNTVSCVAGDRLSIKCNPVLGSAAATTVRTSIQQSATNLYALLTVPGPSDTASGTVYNGLLATTSWSSTEDFRSAVMPCAGTFSNLYAYKSVAPGAGNTETFTLMKNGSASALAAAISGTNTNASDTTDTVTVVAGDRVSIRRLPAGTPTSNPAGLALSFAPTNDGESFLTQGNGTNPSTSATNSNQPMGLGDAWTGASFLMPATTLKAFYVDLLTAPGVGKSYAVTVTAGGSDTALTTTISGTNTTGNITGQTVSISADQSVLLKSVPTGTPAATNIRTGILIYEAPVAGATPNSGFLMFMR